jgi:hypothetical protein
MAGKFIQAEVCISTLSGLFRQKGYYPFAVRGLPGERIAKSLAPVAIGGVYGYFRSYPK